MSVQSSIRVAGDIKCCRVVGCLDDAAAVELDRILREWLGPKPGQHHFLDLSGASALRKQAFFRLLEAQRRVQCQGQKFVVLLPEWLTRAGAGVDDKWRSQGLWVASTWEDAARWLDVPETTPSPFDADADAPPSDSDAPDDVEDKTPLVEELEAAIGYYLEKLRLANNKEEEPPPSENAPQLPEEQSPKDSLWSEIKQVWHDWTAPLRPRK